MTGVRHRPVIWGLAVGALVACGDPATGPRAGGGEAPAALAAPAAAPAAGLTAGAPRVVFLGDSLTAGMGLEESEAFPAVVAELLRARGVAIEAVNAGVSGDTTAGGRSRLEWLLRQTPDVLVVALGANDGLRGLSPEATEENLRWIVERGREAGVEVLLVGIRLPPNYGEDYIRRFRAIFPRLARQLGVPLVPFLLEGVAARPELNLADGIHPNAAGQRRLAETVLPHLLPLLGGQGATPRP